MDLLKTARNVALGSIAVIVVGTTAASLTESYHGLYDWAAAHMVGGDFAFMWPLMVDTFTVVGELLLFVGVHDRWKMKDRRFAHGLVVAGLVVSVLSNMGHVGTHATITDRLTAAVPPVAAWFAMAAALGAFKRIMAKPGDVLEPLGETAIDFKAAMAAFADHIDTGKVPGLNKIRRVMRVGHEKAPQIQQHIKSVIEQRGNTA